MLGGLQDRRSDSPFATSPSAEVEAESSQWPGPSGSCSIGKSPNVDNNLTFTKCHRNEEPSKTENQPDVDAEDVEAATSGASSTERPVLRLADLDAIVRTFNPASTVEVVERILLAYRTVYSHRELAHLLLGMYHARVWAAREIRDRINLAAIATGQPVLVLADALQFLDSICHVLPDGLIVN